MSAPVLTVPQGGPIAARPRRENLYDSEAFTAAGTVTTFSFFQNTRTFSEAAAGAKQFGLDTNLIGNGGSIPRGHYLRVFGSQLYMSRRGTTVLTATALENKRQLFDASFWQLLLGSTPYLFTPTWQVPAGTGISGPVSTTEVGITAGDVQMGWQVCTCYKDLTVPGKIRKQTPSGVKEMRVPRIPIEFAETESFTVNITYPVRPSITGTLFMTCLLVAIYLKPLSG
jgi:hypothetical protein